jgi:PRTRC genetic system protein C
MSKVERVFVIADKEYKDPNPLANPSEIPGLLAAKHDLPHLINSNIDGPDIKDGKAIYTISSLVGEKG